MTNSELDVVDLAQEAMIKSIVTKPAEPVKVTPCADKDTECNQRWIDAFSDCC